MIAYDLLCETNWKMIKGETFSDLEKQKIAHTFLSAVDNKDIVSRFHKGVNVTDGNRMLYPLFFIPPYNNGKKNRLITGELPKTQLLNANHYELEILRILALWDKDNPVVKAMLDETLRRLDAACFAHFCETGECVGAGISVLRLISILTNRSKKWMDELISPLINLHNNCKSGMASIKNNLPVFYLYSALPDGKNELCYNLINEKKEFLIQMLTRGNLTGPAIQDTYNVTRLYVLRNALSILPAFEYMKNREVYISKKDNRCYCDVG